MSNRAHTLRSAAFKAQSGRCYYCAAPIWLTDPESFAVFHGLRPRQARLFGCTAEHLVPAEDGGPMNATNIVAACAFCNSRRHHPPIAKDPAQYRSHVQRRLAAGRWHRHAWAPNKVFQRTPPAAGSRLCVVAGAAEHRRWAS
ncbi:MAG TPA: HNH endonuclease signature motif containing protein [Verrucomicrobiae bacterium]|nr:HNH endonuclease signature motif containing protein [Verrucomicrobiae bacterium]